MTVKEYLETLPKHQKVTMIIRRPEFMSKGLPEGHSQVVYAETPIESAENWIRNNSEILGKDILAFDFPTLSPVWYNWQQNGQIKVILVDALPYATSKPSKDFLNRGETK